MNTYQIPKFSSLEKFVSFNLESKILSLSQLIQIVQVMIKVVKIGKMNKKINKMKFNRKYLLRKKVIIQRVNLHFLMCRQTVKERICIILIG